MKAGNIKNFEIFQNFFQENGFSKKLHQSENNNLYINRKVNNKRDIGLEGTLKFSNSLETITEDLCI